MIQQKGNKTTPTEGDRLLYAKTAPKKAILKPIMTILNYLLCLWCGDVNNQELLQTFILREFVGG